MFDFLHKLMCLFVLKRRGNNKNEDMSEQKPHDSGVQPHDGMLM